MFKQIIIFCFYKARFNEPKDWGKGKVRWTYKLYPRRIPFYILGLILLIPLILWVGLSGLPEIFSQMHKIQSWSSYEKILPDGENPNIWHCYKNF